MKEPKFKVGVIGAAGRVGSQLEDDRLREHPCTHVGSFKSHPEIIVEAICDLNVLKLEEIAKLWGVPYIYTDYHDMMNKRGLDIVSVATPVETHAQIVIDLALKAHPPKLIFCEKPLAESPYDGEKMVNACKAAEIILMVNHTRRWDPIYQHVKQILDTKEIGEISSVVGCASREKDWDGNIHMFDLLAWFSQNNHGLCKYIDVYPSDYLFFELDVFGTKGRIQISNNGRLLRQFRSMKSSNYEGIEELGEIERLTPTDFGKPTNPWLRIVSNMVDVMKEKAQPQCVGDDGLNAMRFYFEYRAKN